MVQTTHQVITRGLTPSGLRGHTTYVDMRLVSDDISLEFLPQRRTYFPPFQFIALQTEWVIPANRQGRLGYFFWRDFF